VLWLDWEKRNVCIKGAGEKRGVALVGIKEVIFAQVYKERLAPPIKNNLCLLHVEAGRASWKAI